MNVPNSNTMPAANPLTTFEHKRDAYGFPIRSQHVQRYREYANIYKEEEEERSDRWKSFLERQVESAELAPDSSSLDKENKTFVTKTTEQEIGNGLEKDVEADYPRSDKPSLNVSHDMEDEEKQSIASNRIHRVHIWTEIRPSLRSIEDMMSIRVNKKGNLPKVHLDSRKDLSHEDAKSAGGLLEDSEDEFYDVERSDPMLDSTSSNGVSVSRIGAFAADGIPCESFCPWKEELEVLVRGGVPMALRGELWQAFLGVKARRVENYYQGLFASEIVSQNPIEQQSDTDVKTPSIDPIPEKSKGQIEKDLPRTFPGHPALDDDGRNALRRLLSAYARHNPSVGYCQGMNFFAALLLLLMPEENAFWALIGIIDDYFDGYYSEKMLESQVDQHAFEELVRERFPKLVNHLDYLGVQVAWITGPWFLTIFLNMLPWETVLRVWDVLLFEGNRVMLFRTALALLEFYGPALVTTKDVGDAITLLQSLASSTFDSSQLVLAACMGYHNVHETRLQELRNKHRPVVIAAVEERTKDMTNKQNNCELSRSDSRSTIADEVLMNLTCEMDSVPDFQGQVVWLKVELCKLLEEKRSAVLRAEELETALLEMVELDNRRELSARVEQLEQEASELQRALSDKQEQENVMLQVLMRVEQEQKVTEDARRFAEQDAAAQRYAAQVLQEKYEEALAALADMEKRAVTAESMLEATLQYQSGNRKAQSSLWSSNPDPEGSNQEAPQGITTRKIGLLSRPFGLGWRDRNKPKTCKRQGSENRQVIQ